MTPTATGEPTAREPVPELLVDLLRVLLLAVEGEGDQPLGQLTAEELAAIDGARARADDRLVELPRVDRLGGSAREAALVAARAGLLARGLVAPDVLEHHVDQPLGLERLGGVLGLLVWLRTSPDGVAWLTTETRSTVRHRYLYGVGGIAVLEERIDDGLHRFTLRSHRDAADALVELVDPDGQAQADGEPLVHDGVQAPAGWERVDAAIAAADRVTRVEAVVADDPANQVVLSLVVGEPGVLVVAGAPAIDADGTTRTAARSASRTTLRELLLEVLATADPGPRPEPASEVTADPGPRPDVPGRPPDG